MKKVLLLLLISITFAATAQTRYVDEVFTEFEISDEEVFAKNYSFLPVLLGITTQEVPVDLKYFTVKPKGDTATNRPVMVLQHTGSFLPPLISGNVLGGKKDSVLMNVARRLAKRGYVVVISDYRKGWIPTAQNVDTRTGSLLTAAYRGIQDSRALARFLRKSVADGNPHGIDPDKFAIMGFGTGGYNAFNTAVLDNITEVNTLTKFISTTTGKPYLDSTLYAGPDGLTNATLNIANTPGYDSRFQFAISAGGAMGDTSWVDGNDKEAVTMGFHSTTDIFAPFGIGDVFVPLGGQPKFVINVSGARATVAANNDKGNNAILNDLNNKLTAAQDFLTLRVNDLKTQGFTTRSGFVTTYATDNFYPFVQPNGSVIANTYNYLDSATLELVVAQFQKASGDTTSAATYIARERSSNPNITNPAGANLVIDTMMNFMLPRLYVGLGIGSADDIVTSVIDITPSDVNFNAYPNPVADRLTIEVNADTELQLIAVYDNQGRRVGKKVLNGNRAYFDTSSLTSGNYFIFVQTDKGALSHKILVH